MSIIKINGGKPNTEDSNFLEFEFSNENKRKLERIEIKRRNILNKRLEWELDRDKSKFDHNSKIKVFWDNFTILVTVAYFFTIIVNVSVQNEMSNSFLIGIPLTGGASAIIKSIIINRYYQKS